jgi:hypothetical protein
MLPQDPFNITPLHVDNFIKANGLIEVKSHLIWEPSSTNLHPDGLFSEGIFGQIGSPERFSRIGFISLNTKVLAPIVFKNTMDLKPMYGEIMSGKVYAKFNEELKEFIPCEKTVVGADTGFSFFLSRFDKLVFSETASHTRKTKIKTIEIAKEKKCAMIERMLVLPAGLRDIKQTGDKIEVEEINKIYTSILSLSLEVNNNLTSPALIKIYDGVKYNLQLKVYELYDLHKEFLSGKTGFAQRRYARRGLAYGSRNVISGAILQANSPTDTQYLKHDETLLGLFQCAKMFQPLVINQLRSVFYSQIFTQGSVRAPAIDTKTKSIIYIEVSDQEINRTLSSDSLEALINTFQNLHMRTNPVSIRDIDNKLYWLFLVYDDGDKIYILRNISDFTEFMNNKNHPVDPSKIRPLTYVEMIYLATYRATYDKHCTITRYPAIEMGSIYPSKIKIGTTLPSRKVKFSSQYNDDYFIELPCYPILGKPYLDTTIIHPAHRAGLNADYDGDTISANGIMSDEANVECREYLNKPRSIISTDGKFIKSASTDLTDITFFNLTRDPNN